MKQEIIENLVKALEAELALTKSRNTGTAFIIEITNTHEQSQRALDNYKRAKEESER